MNITLKDIAESKGPNYILLSRNKEGHYNLFTHSEKIVDMIKELNKLLAEASNKE